jgi:uncharacterized spore protein YtfJ
VIQVAEHAKVFLVKDLLKRLREFYTVERIYGEPLEIKGRTIIPVARINAVGGGGGGGGESGGSDGTEKDSGFGMGFSFGGTARPIGMMVVEDEKTTWIPITDNEKIILKSVATVASLVKVLSRVYSRKARKKEKE